MWTWVRRGSRAPGQWTPPQSSSFYLSRLLLLIWSWFEWKRFHSGIIFLVSSAGQRNTLLDPPNISTPTAGCYKGIREEKKNKSTKSPEHCSWSRLLISVSLQRGWSHFGGGWYALYVFEEVNITSPERTGFIAAEETSWDLISASLWTKCQMTERLLLE